MVHKYIRENKNSYNIVKSSKTYAKVANLDEAIFVRDLLVDCGWNLDVIPQTIRNDDYYIVLAVIDNKLHLLSRNKQKPSQEQIDRLIKRKIRNPNNSRYGLNITRFFDTFIIKKTIFGDDYIFGYYDNLEDAEFVRNFLLDHEWNVNKFDEIEFDDETGKYKVISVIDDAVYVLDSFSASDEIDLDRVHEEFLSKISKHKYSLSNYPHLDLLKDRIEELQDLWHVKPKDDTWSFDKLDNDSNPLGDIIFRLTPFQKSVYDSIDADTSIEDIKKALVRYKSKNFENKIQKNLDDLIGMNLIEKGEGNIYKKTNYK